MTNGDRPVSRDQGGRFRSGPGRGLLGAVRDRRFEQLVRAHQHAVRAYARSMASTPANADDAVQETFLRAWRYLDSFRGDGSFEGWLIRICRRCVIDVETRERRSADASAAAAAEAAWHAAEGPDERGETMALVAGLPPDQREVVVLCGVLGYDYESAAAVLDIPIGTVRSRLHRGRAALAQALEPEAGRATA